MKLKEIDLTKCRTYPGGGGGLTDHPDITPGKKYLVHYNGDVYTGTFSYEWYGLNFNGIYDAGAQFDAPGTNSSVWEKVFEIQPKTKAEAL